MSLLLLFVLLMIGAAMVLMTVSLTMAAAAGDRLIAEHPVANVPPDAALTSREPRPLA